MSTAGIEEKYDILKEKERVRAFALARSVIQRPEISLWMILLPILFIFHAFQIQKYKNGMQAFADNIVRTKFRALDFAKETLIEKKAPEMDVESCFPALDMKDEVMRRVCEKQTEEIRILYRHYRALLEAEGSDYESLLKNVYTDSGKYLVFLNSLEKAEEEVNKYVVRHFQTSDAALEVMKKMAKSLHDLRKGDLEVFRKK